MNPKPIRGKVGRPENVAKGSGEIALRKEPERERERWFILFSGYPKRGLGRQTRRKPMVLGLTLHEPNPRRFSWDGTPILDQVTWSLEDLGARMLSPLWVWLKIKQGGYAGFGPCFHLPGFQFGTGLLSHSQI